MSDKGFHALMFCVLIAMLFILAACGTTVEVKESRGEINCDHCPVPQPVSLDSRFFDEVQNKGTHWELSHEGWEALVAWQHEFERYLEDNLDFYACRQQCIDDYNASLDKSAANDNETPWWKFW